jgi:putative methylase
MTIRSQQDLELALSKLQDFKEPSFLLEQYSTPAHIAAAWVWDMALRGEVAGRTILDAACGPGILGLGLLLMGANKVYFLDKDTAAINICQENYQALYNTYEIAKAEFIHEDITLFDQTVDIVVQNPPFGTKNTHIDKTFLEKAFTLSPLIYSMHKFTTIAFVEAITRDHNYLITHVRRFDFPIKARFEFHEKPVKNIDVGLWRIALR